jgi:hypothetical protein
MFFANKSGARRQSWGYNNEVRDMWAILFHSETKYMTGFFTQIENTEDVRQGHHPEAQSQYRRSREAKYSPCDINKYSASVGRHATGNRPKCSMASDLNSA